ncbi:MAG: hypothetical protein JWR35_1133 [Marmoricola sp.]|jgi:hypothetical protein|nr:hypothetical protein [Marmoricola sp.]
MKTKLALLVGGAAGYVLGTRDGRQRYEQLKTKAQNLLQDPKVKEQVDRVAQRATSSRTGESGPAGSAAPQPGASDTSGFSTGTDGPDV